MDVAAQASLYIPGVDPQPLSVTALGVGPGGRTTWEIHPGVTSGDFNEVLFTGTGKSELFSFDKRRLLTRNVLPWIATLIEGSADARYLYNDPVNGYSIDEGCVFATGVAKCRAAILTDTVVTTSRKSTETISPFAVQGGGPPPSSSPTSHPVVTSAPSSQSGSSSSASPTSPAQNVNGAVVCVPSLSLVSFVLAGLGLLWML